MTAQDINLLPTGSGGNKAITKNVKIARKVSYVTLFVSVLIITVLFAANFVFSRSLKSIQDEQERIKNNISSLEQTESSLILTKDRLGKISQILQTRAVNDNFSTQKLITDNLPENLILENLEINSEESIIEIRALNSRDLVRFMATLLVLSDINELTMENMKFTPIGGYTVVLNIK